MSKQNKQGVSFYRHMLSPFLENREIKTCFRFQEHDHVGDAQFIWLVLDLSTSACPGFFCSTISIDVLGRSIILSAVATYNGPDALSGSPAKGPPRLSLPRLVVGRPEPPTRRSPDRRNDKHTAVCASYTQYPSKFRCIEQYPVRTAVPRYHGHAKHAIAARLGADPDDPSLPRSLHSADASRTAVQADSVAPTTATPEPDSEPDLSTTGKSLSFGMLASLSPPYLPRAIIS